MFNIYNNRVNIKKSLIQQYIDNKLSDYLIFFLEFFDFIIYTNNIEYHDFIGCCKAFHSLIIYPYNLI